MAPAKPTLDKHGLRAVLGFLADDWSMLGRASVVCKTWKTTIAAAESSVWQATLSARWHGQRAMRVNGPNLSDAEALATCKKVAGLVVAPRRVASHAVLLRDQDKYSKAVTLSGLLKRGSGMPTLDGVLAAVREAKIAKMNAHWARMRASGYSSDRIQGEYVIDDFEIPFLESKAAVEFLQMLVKKGESVSFGGRLRVPKKKGGTKDSCETGYEATGLLEDILHDVSHENNELHRVSEAAELAGVKTYFGFGDGPEGDFVITLDDRGRPKPTYYGITRDVLRGVFCDDGFAANGTLEAALEDKMRTWTFFASPDGRATEMYNVCNRSSPDECPPECPTTRWFPGIQFNGDALGEGSLLIAFEHDVGASSDFGPLLQYPVKSIVVLAERAGQPTHAWKPGDGGYYENTGDY